MSSMRARHAPSNTRLPLLAVALAALLAFYYLGRVLVLVADAPTRLLTGSARRREGFLARWRARRRVHTMRGVLAYFEGRWREAVKQLARGARHADAPLLNHLLAARASHALGDDELANGVVGLKMLREDQAQESIPVQQIAGVLDARLPGRK